MPEDVALVGFDDGPMAKLAEPPLTTVHQPMEQIGREMAHMLLSHINDAGPGPSQLVLQTDLVLRATA